MSISLEYAVQKGDFGLDVDVRIPGTGTTGVFGASGSGKTTLLRCIAGLEPSDDAIPVYARQVGYVFQQAQLFSHLDVRRNIEYGAKRARPCSVSVDEIVSLLDLEELLPRNVDSLSGGETQRVAIARALCTSPRIVLMDEPLSAVDEQRKEKLLTYLDRVRAELDVPVIYVSHNIDEICRLCDHLLVMDAGRIVANGQLQEVLTQLDLPQLGGRNTGVVIDADVLAYDDEFDLTTFGFSGGELLVPGRVLAQQRRLRIRASDVSLVTDVPRATSILNVLPAVVGDVVQEGATALVRLHVGDALLIARVTRRSISQLDIIRGKKLYAQIKSVTVRR